MLNLTIKAKLILLGVIAVVSLLVVSVVTYRTNTHIVDRASAMEKIKATTDVNFQLRIDRLQVLLSQFELIAKAPIEGYNSDVANAIKQTANAMREGIKNLMQNSHNLVAETTLKEADQELDALLNTIENRVVPLARSNATGFEIGQALQQVDKHRFKLMDLFREINEKLANEFKSVESQVEDSIYKANNVLFWTSGVALLIMIALLAYIIRSINSPLRESTQLMEKLAQGRYMVEIPRQEQKDEIGIMARA